MITIDDFSKIELKIAKILDAKNVENSEKLLKLSVDLGNEKRQILAGIGKHYTPSELVGKNIVVIANLAPRTIMGEESQGMVLAADGENIILLTTEADVPPGTSVR